MNADRLILSRSRSLRNSVAAAGVIGTLKVYRVGSFEASFVPTIQDFNHLDERFRLPNNVWQNLPNYHDYGFAVFKLSAGVQEVHPMALKFITRNPHEIFFPTVHIHDASVAKTAKFDHLLYLQSKLNNTIKWEPSIHPVAPLMDMENILRGDRTRGIVDRQEILFKRRLSGYLANRDTVVDLS